jgi:aryl-alcohol dehydrogenase-like predicted oxidoreductase
MEYKEIKGLSLPASKVVLGCDSLPFRQGEDVSSLIDGCLALGVNVFDSAHKYGGSEKALGTYFASHHNRDKVIIISKACHPTPEGKSTLNPETLRLQIEESLSYLGYIDIFFLHRDDPSMDLEAMLMILNEYKEKGKIKIYGGSNWTSSRIEEANQLARKHNWAPFMVSSPHYSLANWEHDPWGGVVSLTGKEQEKERHYYLTNQMPLFTYSPLARGFLSGRIHYASYEQDKAILKKDALSSYDYLDNKERLHRVELLAQSKNTDVPSIALAYLFASPLNLFPIIGTTNVLRMKHDIEAMKIKLTKDERDYLNLDADKM